MPKSVFTVFGSKFLDTNIDMYLKITTVNCSILNSFCIKSACLKIKNANITDYLISVECINNNKNVQRSHNIIRILFNGVPHILVLDTIYF